MNASAFVAKWRHVELTERAASHFLDVCKLVCHPSPVEDDPKGERFAVERGVKKQGGGRGWADVWKKDCFAWEYKGKHKDLDAAYDQLIRYRDKKAGQDPDRFARHVVQLFEAMAHGGDFGSDLSRKFNRNLFNDGATIRLNKDEIARVAGSSRLDRASVDHSIFGTLFERRMDPSNRSQLGAHLRRSPTSRR